MITQSAFLITIPVTYENLVSRCERDPFGNRSEWEIQYNFSDALFIRMEQPVILLSICNLE